MKRLIWLPLAGFLLVAGAAIAAAAAAPSVTPSAQTNHDAASAAPTAAASPATNDQNGTPGQPPFGFGFGHGTVGGGADLLDQVLSDLVKAGTITQDQSDAITKALQQQITDGQTQAQQDRQKALQEWQQVQGFLQDGVITQDEVNQLPADSPFRQIFNSIAKNGQITLQQLQQLRMFGPGLMGPGGRPGFGRPGGPWDGGNGQGQNPQASPNTTSTSS